MASPKGLKAFGHLIKEKLIKIKQESEEVLRTWSGEDHKKEKKEKRERSQAPAIGCHASLSFLWPDHVPEDRAEAQSSLEKKKEKKSKSVSIISLDLLSLFVFQGDDYKGLSACFRINRWHVNDSLVQTLSSFF